MQRLFVLDYTRGYLPTLLLASAAYARPGGDVLLADPVRDGAVIATALDRFRPAELLCMGPLPPGVLPEGNWGPEVHLLPADMSAMLSYLVTAELPAARGAVLFPAHSPSWAIKAGALAARLGYVAWPVEEAEGFARAAPPQCEVLVVGEAPGNLQDALQGRSWRHLAGDRAVAVFLAERAGGVDYVVLVNSADLQPPAYHEEGLGGVWTHSLSLLASSLSAFRPALVLDARSPRPDARAIEATLNQKVRDVELRPQYLCILGSPGSVPLIYEPLVEAADGAQEPARDIHLRLDHDLFFDCAEGRIYALSTARASLQVLTTRYYGDLGGAWRTRALLAAHPDAAGPGSLAVDEAVARAQLAPLLAQAGFKVADAHGRACTRAGLRRELAQAGLFLYAGPGNQLEFTTRGRPFYAADVPDLPPAVAVASSGSSMRPRPFLVSGDGGHSVSPEPVAAQEVIGPALVERGAVAAIGALSEVDPLIGTPMYVALLQSLVLRGETLGMAVRAARNEALLRAQVMNQQDRRALRAHRRWLAESIGQIQLLGDPAFAPYAAAPAAGPERSAVEADGALEVSVSIPASAWHHTELPDGPDGRVLLAWQPAVEGAISYGEAFPVAADPAGRSAQAILGAYLHLTADLPPGRAAERLELTAAEMAPSECLLCHRERALPGQPLALLQQFELHFQSGRPDVQHDYRDGWSFAVEERPGGGLRAHWLVPALLVHGPTRSALQVRRVAFRLHHGPAVRLHGRLGADPGARLAPHALLTFARPGAVAGGRLGAVAQCLSGPEHAFAIWLPQGEWDLKVAAPFPLYDFCFQAATGYQFRTASGIQVHPPEAAAHPGGQAGSDQMLLHPLPPPVPGVLQGTVVDLVGGKPLENAEVRVWQGGEAGGRPFANALVAQLRTDPLGRFRLDVPPGEYLIVAHTRTEHKYFKAHAPARVYAGRTAPVVIALEPGATVRGQVQYRGKYQPRLSRLWAAVASSRARGYVSHATVRRSGEFELLVPTTRPFALVMHPDGFRPWRDDNGGKGHWLAAGEEIERSVVLEPVPES